MEMAQITIKAITKLIESKLEAFKEELEQNIPRELVAGKEKLIVVGINLLTKEAKTPTRAREGDACWDIYSIQSMNISPSRTAHIRTGISLEIPAGYMVEIRPRSGLAFKNSVTVQNSPGTIDAGFKYEIYIILHNHNVNIPFMVKMGDRIAQMRLVKLDDMELKENVKYTVPDRGGGFGSTGN